MEEGAGAAALDLAVVAVEEVVETEIRKVSVLHHSANMHDIMI